MASTAAVVAINAIVLLGVTTVRPHVVQSDIRLVVVS